MPKHMLQNPPKRILFIRPSALGDVCRSVSVVASLKAKWPESRIDWLVQDEFGDAISAHPAVEAIIPFPRHAMRRWYIPKVFLQVLWFLRTLKSKQYDLVIDAQGLGRSGLFAWATRAKTRVGSASAREFGWLGYTQKIHTNQEHTVDQMLELIHAIDVDSTDDLQLYLHQRDESWWDSYKGSKKIKSYVVLAPTSRWKSKQWPVERFVAVARYLQAAGNQVVIVGAPHESNQIKPLLSLDGIINVLPEMSIGRLMAVIAGSKLVIANDSAALHIAVGFQRPIIGLFGPTNPARVGPYKREDSVIAADVDYATVHYRKHSIGNSIMQQIELQRVLDGVDVLGLSATT